MDRLRWRLLHGGSGFLRFVDRRFTPAGRAALAGLAASAVLGFDTNQSMAYQSFTFLAALILLAMLGSLRRMARLRVGRTLPRFGSVGQALPYTVTVRNLGRGVLRGLTLREEVADPRPSFETFAAALPGEAGRPHWADRALGWTRWRSLVNERLIASVADVALPDLPPGGSCDAVATLVPARRGRFKLSGVSVARPDPVGLCNAVAVEPAEQLVMILPKRYPVPRLALPGLHRYQEGGVALSSVVGESQEFMSLRDYRPGDPLRRIHWRSWAKRGKPIVRECQDEYFVRHALVLDTFLSAPGVSDASIARVGVPPPLPTGSGPGAVSPRAFEEAVSVAASFASSVLTQESLLDLLFVGAEAYCFTAGRGLGGVEQIIEVLACVEPCRTKPFSELRHSVARRHARLSGVICVLLGWDSERRDLVGHLQSLRVPVVTLVVVDPADAAALSPEAGGFHRVEVGRVAEGLAKL
ncbi:MAG: DUF58 domain-containing protein [Elusimicrobia bacterium]|nr:DUF58 domain-containing protein [Elusimicrobiota bacterium]